MNSTSYINFSAIDYKGEQSLSSYALPITPIKFYPESVNVNDNRVVWDFGDGTISRSLTASKYYEFPGIYTVGLVVYDCNNNAMISTIEKTITIYDYTPFTFNVRINGFLITEDGDYVIDENGNYILTSLVEDINFRNGKIEGPFTFSVYYPPYQSISDIYYTLSGSNSNNYWNIEHQKYVHLNKFYSFYDVTYNYAISSYQYREIDRIVPNASPLYGKINNNQVVECLNTDPNGCLIGYSGDKEVYFKDDMPTDKLIFDFFFDKTNNIINKDNAICINNLGIKLSASVIENQDVSDLSITSNGLDGEGYKINSFNINNIKFFNTPIPFVVKIKDTDWMSIKNFNNIALSSVSISLSSIQDVELSTEDGELLLDELGNTIVGNGTMYLYSDFSLSSLNYTLDVDYHGGSLRGVLIINSSSDDQLLQNVCINVMGTFTNNLSTTYNLSGSSSYFNVYSKNTYDIYKHNENFNSSDTLKNLIFQETLLDKTKLFDDFFGSILGNETYNHETIGVKIYEKISNFVKNTQDIDTCEHDYIKSLADFVDHNDDGEENYTYPEKIKRLMSLISVDKSKLFGESNKFKENLDIRGRSSKDVYGTNIGDKINPFTYIIHSNTPIVALEKFSNSYTLLNTTQPISAIGSHNFPLSAYSSDWGWPLVLPSVFDIEDIEKYYLFFEYVENESNKKIGGLIDFDNTNTSINSAYTNSDIRENGGIFDIMLLDTLYQSLSL